MPLHAENVNTGVCWFVGAAYDGTDDQTPRFLKQGIWENGYHDRYRNIVKSMQPGDRIAVKSTYTRQKGFDFDNHGLPVSVMAIKATGVITENPGDGNIVKVEWTPVKPVREWYFYTNRRAVWRVMPGNWAADALIGFTFDGKKQDIGRFRNAPYWRDRFGDSAGRHREESLRSNYLYQMYAYLRTQEETGDPLARTATGVFLHPVVDEMLN